MEQRQDNLIDPLGFASINSTIKKEVISLCDDDPAKRCSSVQEGGLVTTPEVVMVKQEPEDDEVIQGATLQGNQIIKEEVNIDDTDLSLAQHSDSGMPENKFVPENYDPYGPAPLAQSHQVFIKKETRDEDVDDSNNLPQSGHDRIQDSSFGQHFLTPWMQPAESTYQYSNGQSAEMEMMGHFISTSYLPGSSGMDTSLGNVSSQGSDNDNDEFSDSVDLDDKYTRRANRWCESCDFHTLDQRMWYDHLINVHQKPMFDCQECSYLTVYKDAFHKHLTSAHNYARIECHLCKFHSISFLEVQDHIKRRHTSTPVHKFFCDQCDYSAISACNLTYHIAAKHTGKKDFACPYCEYKSILKYGVARHLWTIHKKRVNPARLVVSS